ncbi:MAG TPA: methyltransferase domain-containing protein [Phycisphaerales bacterium]|nr:methyltransferase domain-containing protein [Phycisphaerales bacterium]
MKSLGVSMMKNYCIRPDYISRNQATFKDMCSRSSGYQRKVYEIARYIAVKQNLRTVVDFGCGGAQKLLEFFPEFQIIGVDLEPTVSQLRDRYPQYHWLTPDQTSEINSADLVICADVIEHVIDPDEVIEAIGQMNPRFAVFSTPDREYLVKHCHHKQTGPPQSIYHVREWTFEEFYNYMSFHFKILKHINVPNVDQECQLMICTLKNDFV